MAAADPRSAIVDTLCTAAEGSMRPGSIGADSEPAACNDRANSPDSCSNPTHHCCTPHSSPHSITFAHIHPLIHPLTRPHSTTSNHIQPHLATFVPIHLHIHPSFAHIHSPPDNSSTPHTPVWNPRNQRCRKCWLLKEVNPATATGQ